MNKKELVIYGVILILTASLVFFATHNYRNEIIITQAAQLQQQQVILQQTNTLLNQVNWTEDGIRTWRQLGYVIDSKLQKQN